MPKFKLTYFNARARGEVIRLVFAAAGIEYEDFRLDRHTEWSESKSTFLFKQVPALEIEGGVTLYQTHAIARYLANEFGLAGKTNLEKAKVDMVADAIEDLWPGVKEYYFGPEEKKADILKELFEKKLPTGLDNLERVLTENNGGDGYFVGDSLTWADLKFHARLGDYIRRLNPDFLKKYTKLSSLMDRIETVPSIKEWVNKRPDTWV
ncbi:hematopoietic prostaglandin D synthase-like [Glandiceps talaboti]